MCRLAVQKDGIMVMKWFAVISMGGDLGGVQLLGEVGLAIQG